MSIKPVGCKHLVITFDEKFKRSNKRIRLQYLILLAADGLSANTSMYDIVGQEENEGIKYRMKNPADLSRYFFDQNQCF